MLAWGTTLAVLAVTGCSFHRGAPGIDAGPPDGTPVIDMPPDTPPGAICFGSTSSLYIECYGNQSQVPTNSYSPPSTFDTSVDANCTKIITQVGGPPLCVTIAGTITVSAATRVRGARAAVWIATDSITISQTVDASSLSTANLGAAANTGPCTPASTLAGTADRSNGAMAGGGGAGGGGFGSAGGAGGTGGAAGGNAGQPAALPVIRGGCSGGLGGGSSDAVDGGSGGGGGGVIYLIAKHEINVTGSVRANGGGAAPGQSKAGGGGGGSGGLIVFDSATLTVTGTVFANGGGGGEGGDVNNAGLPGENPTMWNRRAAGGAGGAANGGDGGDGSVASATGATGATDRSGGGGGGGAGIVKVYPPKPVSGMISPPST